MAGEWPLTGRAEELRYLSESIRRGNEAAGVVIAGALGVGKTRLAREVLATAERRGRTVRWVTASVAAQQLPLGAFASSLTAPVTDPARLLYKVNEELLAGAGRAGALVAVDDAQLLDELSVLLVQQLITRRTATVVLTLRTGAPAPEGITGLWKDGRLRRLELQPLSGAETAALLATVLGGPVDSAAARRMWSITRGNPLYLRHLVAGEVEAHRLHRVAGVWIWTGEPELSPGLTELVAARMGRLTEPVRDVLDVLAVGEPLDVGQLSRLTAAEGIEEAEARGLIEVSGGRTLQARLAHPLYGEVHRRGIGRIRARRLRGLIAASFPESPEPERILRRAVLSLDADLAPDPALLTAAARLAFRMADLALAERLARAAVAAGGGFDSRLALSYALTWLDRGDEADQELRHLERRARRDPERVQVAVPRAGNLFWILRRPVAAERVLDRARAGVQDRAGRAELEALQAAFHAWLARPRRAVRAAERALAAAPSDQAVVLASWGLVTGLMMLGRADAARTAAARGYAAAARAANGAVLGLGLRDLHLVGLRLAGYVVEADLVARQGYELYGEAIGTPRSMAGAIRGQAALAQGRLRTCLGWAGEAHAALAGRDTGGWDVRCLIAITQARAMSGDGPAARAALVQLEERWHPSFGYLEPERLLTRAWVAAAEGAVSEGISTALAAAALAADHDQLAYEIAALDTATRFGAPGQAGRLAVLAEQVDGPRAPIAAAHAAALAGDDPDALLDVSDRLERMGDPLAAADAAAQAAVGYRRRRSEAARSAIARTSRLGRLCEGARTPAMAMITAPAPLTGRELEVVTLAAQGYSNREIGDRLVLSVRTVEGHLYRAAAKLGTSDRAAFAALLKLPPHRQP
ncbi:LuxR C-terminal-related transcriptional regulator [Microlunatus sp. GCM10028923]|uniref:helix-turn-helix transcriptional regulator n=1 Tax=Microlunatus sp. GCM10028923 TaxID=3273400 RepID=UPI00360B4657